MAIKLEAIKGTTIPSGSVVICKSDTGFDRQMLQSLASRLPEDSTLICLKPTQSIEFIDESVMNKAGWFRRSPLILPNGQ